MNFRPVIVVSVFAAALHGCCRRPCCPAPSVSAPTTAVEGIAYQVFHGDSLHDLGWRDVEVFLPERGFSFAVVAGELTVFRPEASRYQVGGRTQRQEPWVTGKVRVRKEDADQMEALLRDKVRLLSIASEYLKVDRECCVPEPPPATPVALLRAFHPGTGDHLYTTDEAEFKDAVGHLGYVAEESPVEVYATQASGTVPLCRLWLPETNDHFYTTDTGERVHAIRDIGYRSEGIAGYVFAASRPGTVPLFRSFQCQSGDHFYTANAYEHVTAVHDFGFVDEGTACYALTRRPIESGQASPEENRRFWLEFYAQRDLYHVARAGYYYTIEHPGRLDASLDEVLAENKTRPDSEFIRAAARKVATDPWGHRVQVVLKSKDLVIATGAGPDGKFGTDDDLHWSTEGWQ